MSLVRTDLTLKDIEPKIKELTNELFRLVPPGVGAKSLFQPNKQQFNEILQTGAKWCIENGYGWEEDLESIEDYGYLDFADISKVSEKAISRGIKQVGTLGSGNHYLEVQIAYPENIIDKELARKVGINGEKQVMVMVHCLPGNAEVLTEHGSYIKIKDLEGKKIKVKCFDEKSHKLIDTEIEKFYRIEDKEKMFKLITESGREIKATEDHPILTKNSLKLINEVEIGDRVAINPFGGVEHEEPINEIIINEEDIRKIHNSDMIVNELRSRDLLPLRLDSEHMPILAKLCGYITGDGHIRKSGRGWRTHINGDVIDLKKIKEDIKRLGFNTSEIRTRKTNGYIQRIDGKKEIVQGESNVIDCNASSFTILLIALSIPLGRKTCVKFEVPRWVFKTPKWIKRLYLAGYFGAELARPIILKNDTTFERLSLAVYKLENLKENGKKFLSQVRSLLKDFNVEAIIIEEMGGGRITKKGKTCKQVLRVSSEIYNLINFWSRIGYEYCESKAIESSQSLQYLFNKKNIIEINAKKQGVNFMALKFKPYQYGINYPFIADFINLYRLNPPTPVVWDSVKKIEEIKNNEKFVYDIRVKNENHNFIANNFIVGNCGSRGFGHELATNYLKIFENAMKKYNINVPDRELACAPFRSKEGQDYYKAMACAANYAYANRQMIRHHIRLAFKNVFKQDAENLGMNLIYDNTHNLARRHKIIVDGKKKEVLVHLKGATTSVGPGYERLTKKYKDIGSLIILGGSMETGSYLLLGTKKAEEETFGSTAHGSGRTMSRTKAKQMIRGDKLQRDMEERGIYVKAVSMSGLAEEAGMAYKEIDDVVEALNKAGISKPIIKLKPRANVKG